MKKLVYLALVFTFTASAAYADMMIPASSLPGAAQKFLAATFPGAEPMYMERDWDSYEVHLNDGSKVEFYINGSWKEIGSYAGIPDTAVPAPVLKTVKQHHPQAKIIKIEKEWNYLEVKLDNGMEMYIDSKGNMMGQKFDD